MKLSTSSGYQAKGERDNGIVIHKYQEGKKKKNTKGGRRKKQLDSGTNKWGEENDGIMSVLIKTTICTNKRKNVPIKIQRQKDKTKNY